MEEIAYFKNFAKLKDTKIAFNDITVLAGKPSTGKSYIMKFIYAMTVNTDKHRNSLEEYLNLRKVLKDEKEFFNLPTQKQKIMIENIQTLDKDIKQLIKNDNSKDELVKNMYKNIINSIFTDISQISNNFEVTYDNTTISYNNQNINYKHIGKYQKKFLNSIFVETPLILEFYKHLDRRKSKTPYHIESLLDILDEDYSFTDEEQDIFIKDFSQKVNNIISGDIKNSNGSFIFSRNNDKNYNIFNASSGTKSIGLLQYLVTNKALKKDSILFWEEPEVHLHPEWQLKMVDLFVELMKAGIKVVFSTHSPYMADYLNAISKKNSYRDRISFNVLDEKDGVVTNHILDDDNWDILQKELMDTFEDILWQYL